MSIFWIIVAAMTLAAVALLAPAFFRSRKDADLDRSRQNVAIARERMKELQADRDAGNLSEQTYTQALAELENTLADDLDTTVGEPTSSVKGGRWALLLIAVLVPVSALGLYWQIGSPGLIAVSGPGAQAPSSPHADGAGMDEMPPVEELVAKLAAQLEENPNNPDGWYLLGRTYMSLQQYSEAAKSFERLLGLVGDEPTVLLSLADSLAMSQGARISGRPAELARRALELEPGNATALWLSGQAEQEAGNYLAAIGYWRKVEAQAQDDPQMLAEIRGLIAEAQRSGNIPDDQMPLPVAGESPPAVMASETTQAPAAAADQTAVAAITVDVALDPALADQVAPDDTVFVFARAVEGPPMPLAVSRHQVRDLPIRIALTDDMAMMPQAKLSNFPRVKVSARVSKSGNAAQQSGDLVSQAAEVEVANSGVISRVINALVP